MVEWEHRGRVQAQGGGVEESIPWAQASPPTDADGYKMLVDLRNRLLPSEQRHRETAFAEARAFILRASQEGGVHAIPRAVQKSFPRKPLPDNRRVDIEVRKGSAFVPESPPCVSSTVSE
jgi:hypothetical protein